MKVIVEADGGSRGNPGPAGYGVVVFSDDRGAVLAERKESIGRTTNNVAEYRGLIAGLTAAAELGATEVVVFMDSKLVVEQMSGRWRVKHPDLLELNREATQVARQFARVDYGWIPRAENLHADRLANEAMDGAQPASAPASPGWSGARGEPTRLMLLRTARPSCRWTVGTRVGVTPRSPSSDAARPPRPPDTSARRAGST